MDVVGPTWTRGRYYSPSDARVDLTKVVDEGWETALILEGDDI